VRFVRGVDQFNLNWITVNLRNIVDNFVYSVVDCVYKHETIFTNSVPFSFLWRALIFSRFASNPRSECKMAPSLQLRSATLLKTGAVMKISKVGVIVVSAVLFVPVAAHAGWTIYEDRDFKGASYYLANKTELVANNRLETDLRLRSRGSRALRCPALNVMLNVNLSWPPAQSVGQSAKT
jgi:hypothetical protein